MIAQNWSSALRPPSLTGHLPRPLALAPKLDLCLVILVSMNIDIRQSKWWRLANSLVAAFLFVLPAPSGVSAAPYVAHEWGTFTSVQGGDGILLEWRPLETSKLPAFVYNWGNAGYSRKASGAALGVVAGKGGVATLQRMETRVIYFYF